MSDYGSIKKQPRKTGAASGSRSRYKYLDAIEMKNRIAEERYKRAQEELREERKRSAELHKKVEMSERIDALMAQVTLLTAARVKPKRKRHKAAKPLESSDAEAQSPGN